MKDAKCSKCGLSFKPYWLKNGVCNGCRNPNMIVECQPVQEAPSQEESSVPEKSELAQSIRFLTQSIDSAAQTFEGLHSRMKSIEERLTLLENKTYPSPDNFDLNQEVDAKLRGIR